MSITILVMQLIFAPSVTGASHMQEVGEKALYCRLFSCQDDQYNKTFKIREAGTIEYHEISPRGFPGISVRGSSSLIMFYRPGSNLNINPIPLKCDYDEIWLEKSYVDEDKVADVSYIYWRADRFQVAITYSAADRRVLPLGVLNQPEARGAIERFLYKLIDNEWFVLNSISDKQWFTEAVKSLRNLQ